MLPSSRSLYCMTVLLSDVVSACLQKKHHHKNKKHKLDKDGHGHKVCCCQQIYVFSNFSIIQSMSSDVQTAVKCNLIHQPYYYDSFCTMCRKCDVGCKIWLQQNPRVLTIPVITGCSICSTVTSSKPNYRHVLQVLAQKLHMVVHKEKTYHFCCCLQHVYETQNKQLFVITCMQYQLLQSKWCLILPLFAAIINGNHLQNWQICSQQTIQILGGVQRLYWC